MEFRRKTLINNHTAATEVLKKDLPTNPLSHIVVTLAGYNATDETTLAEILAFINSMTVIRDGETIYNCESEDAYGVHSYVLGRHPVLSQKIATDNSHRALSLIIPFGRALYNPEECLPATKKGELEFQIDYTAPATSMDNGILTVETIELIGANPQNFLKSKTKTVTAPGATGSNEAELPIGNKLVCVQVRMTTFPATSSHTYGVSDITILKSNKEIGFNESQAVSLHGSVAERIETQPGDIAAFGHTLPLKTVWIDFDPVRDSKFLLDTAGASRMHADLNMGVDEATYLTIMELCASNS